MSVNLFKPINPEGHVPIKVNVVNGPIRYAGIDEMGWESERETIVCVFCRQDWPCDWLEKKHPGLRERTNIALGR